jgi:hypothetical protein
VIPGWEWGLKTSPTFSKPMKSSSCNETINVNLIVLD